MGDPQIIIKRYAWVVFTICCFMMLVLLLRDDMYTAAAATYHQVRTPYGWGFIRMGIHILVLAKFLTIKVQLVRRKTVGYLALVAIILTLWDGLSPPTAGVVLIMLCISKVLNDEITLRFFPKHKKHLTPTRLNKNRQVGLVLLAPLVMVLFMNGAEIVPELKTFTSNWRNIVRYGPDYGNPDMVSPEVPGELAKVRPSGVHVLVVGTNVEDANALQAVLQGVGHTVTVAANQQDASLLAAEYAFRALLISDQIEASQAETLERELPQQCPSIISIVRAGVGDAGPKTQQLGVQNT